MKKLLMLLAILLDGVLVGLIVGLLLSKEHRLKFSRQLAPVIEGIVENVPDE
jgi:hypothetical protein